MFDHIGIFVAAFARFIRVFLFGIIVALVCPAANGQTADKEWQLKAIEKYPALGEQGSEFNKHFLSAYAKRQAEAPGFFLNPKWPLLLADEVASSAPANNPTPTPEPVTATTPFSQVTPSRVTPSPAQVETETPSLNLVPPHLSKGTITAIFVTGVVSVLILLIVAATNRSNRKRITSKFSSAISQVTGSSGLPPEETLWIGCPSQWNYLWSWVFGLLLLVVGAGFIMIMGIIIDRARRVYIVTNRRVIFQYGLFAKSTNEIRIKDIRSINVAKSGISGLIGVGNVEFSSAAKDRAEVIFAGISEADVIRDMVGKLQADA